MTWEDEGLEPGESPEDRREFRRMMDSLGREGILRMVERLTGEIEVNPRDTQRLYTGGRSTTNWASTAWQRKTTAEPSRWTRTTPTPAGAGPRPCATRAAATRPWRTWTAPWNWTPATPRP